MEENTKIFCYVGGSVLIGLLGYAVKGLHGMLLGIVCYWAVIGIFSLFLKQRKESD